MNHTMLESRLFSLATRTRESDSGYEEAANELDLKSASVHMGNFQAFLLMQDHNQPNDGMLHLASMLALSNVVEWLLANGHDPNHQIEETGPLIPLALTCSYEYQPSCKIANKELDKKTRQKKTMALLAAHTNLDWKYKNKSVLHFALDEGVKVSKAMIEVLDIPNDPNRDERYVYVYVYVDLDEIHYSPDQYIKRPLTVEAEEKRFFLKAWTNAR